MEATQNDEQVEWEPDKVWGLLFLFTSGTLAVLLLTMGEAWYEYVMGVGWGLIAISGWYEWRLIKQAVVVKLEHARVHARLWFFGLLLSTFGVFIGWM